MARNGRRRICSISKKDGKKAFGPIYKAFDNLPVDIKEDIKELIEAGGRVTECLYEIGDAYMSDIRKLCDNCHSLKALVQEENRYTKK
tara:strand:+ start:90 stop:353 length:264 start_codon:yes stop_codon:yes gene_type:complete